MWNILDLVSVHEVKVLLVQAMKMYSVNTHAAVSELFGVDRRGEVEAPSIAGRWVFPVHKAL